MHFPLRPRSSLPLAGLLTVGFLGGCGGGDAYTAATTTPPVTPAALTLTGTAATGAAVAGGQVTAHCVVGTASGLSDAAGVFTLTLDKGQVAPCLLQVTKAGTPPALSIELYGFAAVAGRVDITTLTDSVLNRALGASPAAAFASFSSAQASSVSAALPAAISYVQAQWTAAALGSVPADLMTANFAIGDVYDKLLDNLGAALLGAGKTYADFIALVKKGADTIPVTTPITLAASDITVSPAILALPLTGKISYLTTAADTAGFAGSHVFGRGVRSAIATLSKPFPAYSLVSGCTLTVDGGDLVFSASGQTTRVSLTPTVVVYQGVSYPSSYASVAPRNAYGNVIGMTLVSAVNAAGKADAIALTIENGVVTDASANDGATATGTACGAGTAGNLNTDRSADLLSLPTDLVAALKTEAVAKGLLMTVSKAVTAADLTGFAAAVNFGRGVLTTYNSDFTVKDVLRVSDCKTDISNGQLHMSSVQGGYDRSFTLDTANYIYKSNDDQLIFSGRERSGDLTSGSTRIFIDRRTATPFVSRVESTDLINTKISLSCPRG